MYKLDMDTLLTVCHFFEETGLSSIGAYHLIHRASAWANAVRNYDGSYVSVSERMLMSSARACKMLLALDKDSDTPRVMVRSEESLPWTEVPLFELELTDDD